MRWERVVSAPGLLTERLVVTNHRRRQVRLTLDLRLAADFVPMLAIRGLVPRGERPPAQAEAGGADLTFSARGRDGVVRKTIVEFGEEPAAGRAGAGRVRVRCASRSAWPRAPRTS